MYTYKQEKYTRAHARTRTRARTPTYTHARMDTHAEIHMHCIALISSHYMNFARYRITSNRYG